MQRISTELTTVTGKKRTTQIYSQGSDNQGRVRITQLFLCLVPGSFQDVGNRLDRLPQTHVLQDKPGCWSAVHFVSDTALFP